LDQKKLNEEEKRKNPQRIIEAPKSERIGAQQSSSTTVFTPLYMPMISIIPESSSSSLKPPQKSSPTTLGPPQASSSSSPTSFRSASSSSVTQQEQRQQQIVTPQFFKEPESQPKSILWTRRESFDLISIWLGFEDAIGFPLIQLDYESFIIQKVRQRLTSSNEIINDAIHLVMATYGGSFFKRSFLVNRFIRPLKGNERSHILLKPHGFVIQYADETIFYGAVKIHDLLPSWKVVLNPILKDPLYRLLSLLYIMDMLVYSPSPIHTLPSISTLEVFLPSLRAFFAKLEKEPFDTADYEEREINDEFAKNSIVMQDFDDIFTIKLFPKAAEYRSDELSTNGTLRDWVVYEAPSFYQSPDQFPSVRLNPEFLLIFQTCMYLRSLKSSPFIPNYDPVGNNEQYFTPTTLPSTTQAITRKPVIYAYLQTNQPIWSFIESPEQQVCYQPLSSRLILFDQANKRGVIRLIWGASMYYLQPMLFKDEIATLEDSPWRELIASIDLRDFYKHSSYPGLCATFVVNDNDPNESALALELIQSFHHRSWRG
jgi:hypothetical protein